MATALGRFRPIVIALADILANEDPFDTDGDGISGRANRDGGAVGRFGYKAQESGLEDFIRGPLFNHLGITSDPLSEEMRARLPVPSQSTGSTSMGLTEGDVGASVQAQASAPSSPMRRSRRPAA